MARMARATGAARAVLRHVPGAGRAYRGAVERVRAMPADSPLRAAALRASRAARPRRSGPVDITAGRYFVPGKGRTLPVVVLVATGLGPGDAEILADEVEHAQMTTAGFRPLCVIDSSELAPFRARGFAVERVMPEAAFAQVNPHQSWADYVYERVASIAQGYRAASVVPLPPGRPDALPRTLLRLVGAPGARR
jgi:hypothetical protein